MRNMAPVAIKRVLISESVDPCCKKILQENGIEVAERPNMTKDELKAQIKVLLMVTENAVIVLPAVNIFLT